MGQRIVWRGAYSVCGVGVQGLQYTLLNLTMPSWAESNVRNALLDWMRRGMRVKTRKGEGGANMFW